MPNRLALALAALLVSLVAGPAVAQPLRLDLERLGPSRDARQPGALPPEGLPSHGRAWGRSVDGGPGYVGSDYGLGKPAFTGLGSRPDWGRSE